MMNLYHSGVPLLLVGPPGVGKTASVRAAFSHCETVIVSSWVEEDIAGIPYRDGALERRTTPPYIQRLQAAKGTKCLFLDELDKATTSVADTLLSLVTHPQDYGVPDGTQIIAAANPPEWGGGTGISRPMHSRFATVQYVPNIEPWAEYMRRTYPSNPLVEKLIVQLLNREIPMLECNGEDLDWRLTCPRTLDLAVRICIENPAHAHQIVPGLLTANAASGLLALMPDETSEEPAAEAQKISRSIGGQVIRKHTPVRKPLT